MTLLRRVLLHVDVPAAENTRLIAYDRRMAAIHESGHLVIGQMLGFPGRAHIQRYNEPGEKTWIGSTTTLPRITIRRGETRVRAPSKTQKQMIAVAGAIAEECWLSSISGELEIDIDWWDPDAMSETDWSLSGCPIGEPSNRLFTAADKVAALLRPDGGRLWPTLILSARNLIVASRTTTTPVRGDIAAEAVVARAPRGLEACNE
jgi:hypothetical protein